LGIKDKGGWGATHGWLSLGVGKGVNYTKIQELLGEGIRRKQSFNENKGEGKKLL